MPGPVTAEPDGFANWQNKPQDDDRHDDADSGLLSRRFGRDDSEPPRRPPTRTKAKGKKRRSGRGKVAFTIAIAIVVLIVGVAAAAGYNFVHRWIDKRYGDYVGNGYGTVQVTVRGGADLTSLGPLLLRRGVIKALRPYDTAASTAKNASSLQPGVYDLHHHMNAALAVHVLLAPPAKAGIKVTIIEGTRAADIATQIASAMHEKASAFTQIIDHPPATLGLPSWAKGSTAEGFLFPDTYYFQPHENALKILQMMVSTFNQQVLNINLADEAAKVHTTPWHVLIMASMVQAESGPGDFGKVARVGWNRIIRGMPLHFDSTVFYGLKIPVNKQAAATSAEIHKDTPYNTYIHAGFPPGPIGNPGLAALKAALHPPHGPWLYFITDLKVHPSVTKFTASYTQFLQWQRQYQG